MSGESPFREIAIDLLQLYASPELQRQYQADVPFVPVPVELLCMWFDDFWHVTEELRQSFSELEFEALESFHRVFAARGPLLGDPLPDLDTMLTLPLWAEIVACARDTLDVFVDPDPEPPEDD
jgi:hypothetical protein